MSFFPDSQMQKLHSQQYFNTPMTPDYNHERRYVRTVTTSESHPVVETSPPSWHPAKASGLGLLPAKLFGPSSSTHNRPEHCINTFACSQTMPSPYQFLQEIPELRRDMWADTPTSTTQSISDPMWSTLPCSSIEVEAYNSSDCSRSSAASSYSSPYITNTHFIDDSRSPFVKIESPFDVQDSPQTVEYYEQLRVVNPQDIVTHAPPLTPRVVFTPLLTPLTPMIRETSVHSSEDFKPESGSGPAKGYRRRGFTTPEDATCSCKQCGKLFRRISNLAAHMQTHDEYRDQPWECRHAGCLRRFNRRTDMERHNKSVHVKAKPHRCEACGRCFARRDTLCRHESGGCPKQKIIHHRVARRRNRTHTMSAPGSKP